MLRVGSRCEQLNLQRFAECVSAQSRKAKSRNQAETIFIACTSQTSLDSEQCNPAKHQP